jgi:murein lipoprotein
LIFIASNLQPEWARVSSRACCVFDEEITAEGNMKITFGKVLPAVLLGSTLAVGACASSGDVDDLKASVSTLQRDVAALKSDTAAARSESAKAAQEARSAAAAAQQAAAEAKAAANAANAATEKSDRMFQKSLRK